MALSSLLRSSLRTFGAALLISLALVRPAAAVDWTDIWWATPEVGWGVNFVQSNNFIFATFFVHGPDLQPDWYTGEMTVDKNTGIWSGPLYRTTGSYFGTTYSSSQTSTVPVGTVTFVPKTAQSGTLTYNVNTVSVLKEISRLTLTPIPLGGSYFGGLYQEYNSCGNPSLNGVVRTYSQFDVIQTSIAAGSQMQLSFQVQGGSCTLTGGYVQDGVLFRMPTATYVCSTGVNTVANVTQVKATAQGLEGQWIAGVGGGCVETGFFSAVLY
jgi:hypothetical protein